MVKKRMCYLWLIIFLIIIIPSVQAVNSQIIVNTEPYHDLIIRIVSGPDSDVIIDSVYGRTNESGQAIINYSTSRSDLSFLVMLRLFGETIETKRFNDVPVSGVMHLNFKNETQQQNNNNNNQQNNQNQSQQNNQTPQNTSLTTQTIENGGKNKITGFFISESGGPSKNAYYVLIILAVGIVMSILVKTRRRIATATTNLFKRTEKTLPTFIDELLDAEKKIKEAEAEIKRIKSRNADLISAEQDYIKAKQRYEALKKQDTADIQRLKDAME